MVKRDYIVARAASMFETQGVKSVRIDDIASELGMSKRTLYEMFDSKEALLKECMRHLFVEKQEKMWQEIERLPDVVAVIFLSISIFANTLMLIAMNKIKLHNNISMDEAFEYMAINFFRGIATVKGVELIDAYHRKYRSSVQDGRTD